MYFASAPLEIVNILYKHIAIDMINDRRLSRCVIGAVGHQR